MKDYSPELQKLFLEIILQDAQNFVRVQNIFNPDNFDRSLKETAKFISEYSNKYAALPTHDQITATTGVILRPIPEFTEQHNEWFLEEFEGFTKRRSLERAILKSADLLEKGVYEPVEKLIKDAVQISLTKDMGTDYFADPKDRLLRIKSNKGQVSTGWPALDSKLFGGMSPGELNIFAGGSGCVTADTQVEVIELPDTRYLSWHYSNVKSDKIISKKVPIGSLKGRVSKDLLLVSSPDGWVPVLDCVEKQKDTLYRFYFNSGRVIESSYDHLYQKPDQSWCYTKDLRVGDTLLSEEGTDTIIAIDCINEPTKVYDLAVGHPNHRYYTNGICSHNSGKSLFMQNIAVNWIQAGLNGVYISLELSEELCSMRIDSMIANCSTKELFKNLDDVELKIKMASKKCGQLRIKYMPAQSNINDIRSYLKELHIQTGLKADFIMVDYLDLLMPVSAKVSPNDLFVKDKYVSEELRNLAKEFHILMITASQLNRCLALDTKVICNGFETDIRNVKVGDVLLSNTGTVIVTEVLPVTKQSVYRIKTKSGKEIVCSDRHLFPTKCGLRNIQNGLRVGDFLLTNTLGNETENGNSSS